MKIFIAGPRKVSNLNNDIVSRLKNIKNKEYIVLVGDANGVDSKVQEYFYNEKYNNVMIYATNGIVRNNIGNWDIVRVDIKQRTKNFKFYTAKDEQMAKDCDYGFMIWNGESKGTLNNIINLVNFKKKVLIYFLPENSFYTVKSNEDINMIIEKCDYSIKNIYNELLIEKSSVQQISISY